MMEETFEVPHGAPAPRVDSHGPASLADTHSDIFFAAIQTTRMPMIVTDPHQRDNPIIFANRAFETMTGYDMADIVGTNCRFLQGPETSRAAIDAVRTAIRQRRDVAVEVLNYRKDGSAFWNALFVSPVFDKAGDLVYFFGSQLDVSRRRDAEEALRQAQKMEALGQLTGGIAHDFNNLLQVVVGYTDLLRQQIAQGAGARAERSLENIATAARRATTLTQQLLAFARKQHLEGRPVNLNGLVETMGTLADRTLGDRVAVHTRLAPDLWNARLDPVQAEMAILNVLINARDAMPEGGDVTLETRNQAIGPGDELTFAGLAPGRYVTLAIADTGTGMPPDVLERVMEPFFTTKESGKGTGLGLAMVYGFARQSGGVVRIQSEPGQGTTVRLFFPATDQPEGASQRPAAPNALDRQGSETILVVEDRPDVADLARSILEEFGYKVLTASAGREALETLEGEETIALLFSDLMMPGGMNGVVLAREAKKLRPRIKVLLTTGYAEESLERTDAGGEEFELLNKPYRRMELVRRVRTVLDGPTGVG